MSRDHNETLRHKTTSRFTSGGKNCLLARDITNQSYAPNTPLTQATQIAHETCYTDVTSQEDDFKK